MQIITREKIIQERLFQTSDGKVFEFSGLAKDHEIEILTKELEPYFKKSTVIPFSEIEGKIYELSTKESFKAFRELCQCYGASFDAEENFPMLVFFEDGGDLICLIDDITKSLIMWTERAQE